MKRFELVKPERLFPDLLALAMDVFGGKVR